MKILNARESKKHLSKPRTIGLSEKAYQAAVLFANKNKMSLSNIATCAILNYCSGIPGQRHIVDVEAKKTPAQLEKGCPSRS